MPKNQKPDVVIYTSPTCTYCTMAKELFDKHEIAYTEHDVLKNEERRREVVAASGQRGVPVILVGDDMVIGYDEPKLRELLEIPKEEETEETSS